MRVAVLRCDRLPRFVTWEIPDVDALFDDDRRLIEALERRGIRAESVPWTAAVDWADFDVAVLRSTWDYVDRLPEFLAALEAIEQSGCRVRNPLDAVRWNADKRYLEELDRLGVPVVPLLRVSPSDAGTAVRDVAAAGWDDLVVKPTVGVGAADVVRLPATRLEAHLASATGPVFVQPFASSVVEEGEYSYALIAGAVSHALRKRPASGDFRAHGIYGGTVEPHHPSPGDLAEILDLSKRIPFGVDYARVDVVRFDGRLAVLELELIEPILYLSLAAGSADQLADAVVRRGAD